MNLQTLLQHPTYPQKFILEKLMQEFLHLRREELRLHLDDELPADTLQRIQNAYHAHTVDKQPLEYLLGHVDFFGVPFYVNEATIIPRPETEYMITAVGERLKQQKKSDFSLLLDIGTGSGVLGISLLLQHPDTFREVYLTDISPAALEVAKKNYATLITQPQQYETHFLQSDLAAFMSTEAFEHQRKKAVQTNGHIVLVANLPYIPDETFDTNALEQMQKREPRLAFVGGNDGLALYRTMFAQIKPLRETGKLSHQSFMLFLEMMTRQVEILQAEFGERIHFEEVKTFHFNIRIVQATVVSQENKKEQ